ncbi:NAC domain-containing protein 19-like [Macadamia integrifolia]|uniref:NAC domain-containing protein 19-like n=1 Tax=Macadamia integrifolia TaxID=60698 RepID=UPI001C52BABB|nr:NAC domain-containing protein 19-like [Macadamia integrifolia]
MSSFLSTMPSSPSRPSPPSNVYQEEIDQSEKMDFQSQPENVVGGMQKGAALHEDDDNSAYFNSLPPGFRFCPNDYELINYYLKKKITNQPLPINRIRDVELYKHNPDYLAEKYQSYGEDEWYFFTPRDRKYKNGFRPNRAAGKGYWKATGADKKIYSNDELVGYRKALVFYIGKAPKGDKSDWIMHEFRVVQNPPLQTIRAPNDMKLDDCVLCKMYKKPEKPEAQDTEIQAKDANTRIETGDHSDVGDENHVPANTDYNNSNSSRMLCSYSDRMDNCMGLINPSGWDESGHSLQYNLPPEPNQMLTGNYPYQSNINFGYGDPGNSVLQPISFMPPAIHFMESNYQETGNVYNDSWGFKQEDSSMLPQYDFKQEEDYNMLLQYDFSNQNCLDPFNFLSDDINLPNTTGISPVLKDKSSFTNKNANDSG